MGRVPYLMEPRGTAEGRVHYLVVLMMLLVGYMLLVVLIVQVVLWVGYLT